MTAALITSVGHGVLSLGSGGGFTYTPAAGFSGNDSFTYRAATTNGPGNAATVMIAVSGPAAPMANNDAFSTAFGTALVVPGPGVLANDLSNGGGAMSATLVAAAGHGSLTLSANGGFTYAPAATFVGNDTFSYRAVTVGGQSNVATVNDLPNWWRHDAPAANRPLRLGEIVGDRVTLRWIPPGLGPAPATYVLEGGVAPNEVLASISTGSPYPIFTFTAPTGSFYVRVHAIAGASQSRASNEVRLHVNVPVAPAPSAPSRPQRTGQWVVAALAWTNTFGGGAATAFSLEVSGAITASLPLGLTDSFSFAGVPPGTYSLALRASNAGGASALSNVVTLTFPGPCSGPPTAPVGFLAHRLGSTIHVVWQPSAAGPAPTSYQLDVTGAFVGSFTASGRTLSGAAGPGSYGLSVRAVNACGIGAATAEQTVIVP